MDVPGGQMMKFVAAPTLNSITRLFEVTAPLREYGLLSGFIFPEE